MCKTEIIGKNIEYFRRLNGLSQEQLGRLAKCGQKTISRYERGEVQHMSRAILEAIAVALMTTIKDLEDIKNVEMWFD